jgi:hypothetical protein
MSVYDAIEVLPWHIVCIQMSALHQLSSSIFMTRETRVTKMPEVHSFTIKFLRSTECTWLSSVPTFLHYFKPYLLYFKHRTENKYPDNRSASATS